MATGADGTTRNTNAQSKRTLRVHERRGVNHLEVGGKLRVLNQSAADVPVVGSLLTSDAFQVDGFDRVTVEVNWTKGSASVGYVVLIECSADQVTWASCMVSSSGTLAAESYASPNPQTDANQAFDVVAKSKWMRLKFYATAAATSSRAVVYVTRTMNAS